jgi:DNA-binding CsgD family transcriptional regulator
MEGSPSMTSGRPVLCPILIGRDDEMRVLAEAMHGARAQNGSSIIILGEAGVGKSRLARETADLAQSRGLRVLWGRCVEGGDTTPYRPFAEALLSTLRASPLPELPELKPFRPILGRLIPDYRTEATLPEQSVVLLGEAIVRLLRALTSTGCILILEDVHWADPETLAVIDYIAANLATEPLLVLMTLRSGVTGAGLTLARSLLARRIAQPLELRRLDPARTRLMAQACLGGSPVAEPVERALESSAEGLPLLIEDLLADWVASGTLAAADGAWHVRQDLAPVAPVSFAERVNRGLEGLGDETTRLLRLAALLGRRFRWDLLPGVAGLDEEKVLELLDRAVQAQLVAVETDGAGQTVFHFRHVLTQAAILAGVLPPQRARLAARLLSSLRAAHPGLPDDWCDLAARLAQDAGDWPQAARLLLESGRRALARGALATAEITLERARDLCGQVSEVAIEIDETLLDVLSLAGKHERVATVGENLLGALTARAGSSARVGRAHLRIARAAVAASNWPDATRHLDAARALVRAGQGEDSEAELVPRVDALAAQVAVGQARLAEAAELARSAQAAAQRAGLWEVACEALEVLGRCARTWDLDQAELAFEQARRIAERHDLMVWRVRALHELATIDLFRPTADPERLFERLSQARELAEVSGALATAAMIDVQLAAAYYGQGHDLGAILEVASRSADISRRLGLDLTRAAALRFKALVYAQLGNRQAMEAALAECLEAAGPNPEFEGQAWGDARANASLVEEDRKRALHELEVAQGFMRLARGRAPHPNPGVWALLRTIEGEEHGGIEACEEVAAAPLMTMPINQAYLRFADAVRLGRARRGREAAEAFAAGAELLPNFVWYRYLGYRLVAEEAIAHGWGEPAPWLAEAAAFFEQHEQPRLVSACRSLLRQCGVPTARSRRAQPSVPPGFRARGVTAREMDVLLALTNGLSNKEIGEQLFLSRKTVEKHVSSLMDKLGVRTRVQLAALAASARPAVDSSVG